MKGPGAGASRAVRFQTETVLQLGMLPEGSPGKYTVTVTRKDGTYYRSDGVGTEAEAKKLAAEYTAAGYKVEVTRDKSPEPR